MECTRLIQHTHNKELPAEKVTEKKLRKKVWYEENKHTNHYKALSNARGAKRRAAKLQATPEWADIEKIREFYLECPEGHHVDHVVPLQGELVCGLHVLENLQYLTVEENLKKGNKW